MWYEREEEKTIAAPETPLTFAVAASSAFPPLFPPITVTHKILSCDVKDFPHSQDLTDGGVYDNLGINRLLRLPECASTTDPFLVSNAGGNFDWNFDAKYTFITSRNIRASDLMMKRVSDLEYTSLSPRQAILFDIGSETQWQDDDTVLIPELQRGVRNIRTDLDSFSTDEILSLIQHGYTVAREAAITNGLVDESVSKFSWKLTSESGGKLELDPARRIVKVRRLRLWSYRDWVSWVSLSVILVACFLVVVSFRVIGQAHKHDVLLGRELKPLIQLDIDAGGEISQLALSQDGLRVAFVSKGQLAIQLLDQNKTALLADTEGAEHPFFSKDGQWVAFFAAGKLKKVAVVKGGAPVTLCDSSSARGGTWRDDENIVAALSPTGGLSEISSANGIHRPLTDLKDDDIGVDSHRWPEALPGGGILFAATIQGRHGSLRVLPPGGGKAVVLVENATYGRYVKSGYLVYYQGGTLFAAGLDLDRLKLGPSVPLLVGVAYDRVTGHADFDVSAAGSLVYLRDRIPQRLVRWLDLKGKDSAALAEPGDYSTPRLSPDGTRLALCVERGAKQNLWIFDLPEQGKRVTFDGGPQSFPVWTPDAEYLVFESESVVGWTRAEGGRPISLLKGANRSAYPWSFSPDGRILAFTQAERTGWTLWTVPVERVPGEMRLGQPKIVEVGQPGDKAAPAISPDGRWLAFGSNESGHYEIYVTALRNSKGGVWQVSDGGGRWPVWGRDGRELFYENPERRVIATRYINRGDAFVKQNLRVWSQMQLAATNNLPAFDVGPNGNRLIALLDSPESAKPETHIRVMLNVDDELRRDERSRHRSK